MAATIVLLHSPLVGAGSWTKVAARLSLSGRDTVTPDLASVFDADAPYYARLAAAACRAIDTNARNAQKVLVVHSGAGALAPAIADGCAGVCAIVFVDALLPHPGRDWFSTAPAQLVSHLESLVRDGRLPRWHEWWPQGAIENLLGDKNTYESFVAGLPEVPRSYFSELAPRTALPQTMPSAYLQLSEACRSDADEAQACGWTVQRLALNHLAMLTHPNAVARELDKLIAEILDA